MIIFLCFAQKNGRNTTSIEWFQQRGFSVNKMIIDVIT